MTTFSAEKRNCKTNFETTCQKEGREEAGRKRERAKVREGRVGREGRGRKSDSDRRERRERREKGEGGNK